MTHRITFLRHAESEGNAQNLLQGRSDIPLSARGRQQALTLAEQWQERGVSFDLALTSPLLRARQTAETVAEVLAVPLEIEEHWLERSFGLLDGKSNLELHAGGQPVDFHLPYDPIGENGESLVDVYIRALAAIQSLLRRPAGRYLVVTHGAMLSRLMYVIFGITPQGHYNSPLFSVGNTGYLNFTYHAERRQWRFYGFHSLDEWEGHFGE